MFGLEDLRPQLEMDDQTMACPVRGCTKRVPIQKKTFAATDEFLCPTHHIFIGRTTFEYQFEEDNFLWTRPADRARLATARKCKRESRMNRERSEDALSWNVFRQLEVGGRLAPWASSVTSIAETGAKAHYWSCDAVTGSTWQPLADARRAFGELAGQSSEPDLVITTEDADIWVEAKFGSTNDTHPRDPARAQARYSAGGTGWYSQVVNSGATFERIAVEKRRYELLRFWLLGSWAAEQRGKRFELVNLVREGMEEDVAGFAADHLQQTPSRRVHRATWESVAAFIAKGPNRTSDDETLLRYMRTKTLGYGSNGRLVRAFSMP